MKRTISGILIFLLVINTLMFRFSIQPAKSAYVWTETIYIRADGNVEPSAAPISTLDNVTYTLTDNVIDAASSSGACAIVVERDNIVLDGAGYTLQGTKASNSRGLFLYGRSNVTIKNITIKQLHHGIYLENSSHNTIFENNVTDNVGCSVLVCYSSNYNIIYKNRIINNSIGILLQIRANHNQVFYNEVDENGFLGMWVWFSSFNNIWGNNITANARGVDLFADSFNNTLYMNHIKDNGQSGLYITNDCASNTIYHNNFVNNTCQVNSGAVNRWDDGYPSGGNYWSNYIGVDLYSGPYQNETGSDGIGDEPYVIDENNQDRYPLMNQIAVSLPWRDWTHYHNYNELVSTLFHLYTTYPEIVDIFPIGKSWQNRSIYCIKLTNKSITNPKPKLLFIGYHHAREPISAELPLYFAVDAATNFGINETITRMLNYSEIYIIPALNVDGLDAVKLNEWQRKNVHPYDEDGDGLLDEDPPDDEDGDGYIEDLVFMNNTHYYFIRWEGIDGDGDGLYNEDWIGGVDLNRNYDWDDIHAAGSPNPYDETYRGPEPFSEPETRAIKDLASAHYFKYAISFHSGADYISYGFSFTNEAHNRTFMEVASNLSMLVGAPYYLGGAGGLPTGFAGDWMYGNRNTFHFTCEIYVNYTAWQYEPGPEPDTYWEKGITQFFNPEPTQIMAVIERWLPVFTYLTNRAVTEASKISERVQQVIDLVDGSKAYEWDVELENIALSHPDFRSAGSIGANETANLIKEKFESFGLDTWLEPFQFVNWSLLSKPSLVIDEDGNQDTTNDQHVLNSFQCSHYSWPTPGGGIFADLVILPLPPAADHTELGKYPIDTSTWDLIDTTGKIVLIGAEVGSTTDWWLTFSNKISSETPAAIVYTRWYSWMNFTPPAYGSIGGKRYWNLGVPTGAVDYWDGLLVRQLENAQASVSANFTVEAIIGEGVHYNVVGKIVGFERPEKLVIISGHYDTVMCSGFCDNGAGTAGVIELARVFAEAVEKNYYHPKYTLLFVCFTGEELGLVGSAQFISQHKNEMENIVAVINLDGIGSDDLYVSDTPGSDLRQTIMDAAADLGIAIYLGSTGGSDQESFRNPSGVNDFVLANWGVDLGISDANLVESSALLISYPLFYSDLWNMGTPGWIHTAYDNSTSTETLNWVEAEDLENHIKVAALTIMRVSPDTSSLVDVALLSIVSSKTVVGQGYAMQINVTVANQGDFTETFNVTLYANTTAIETKEITLEISALTTITFTWNTSGYAKGNYTISAYAWPVPGEAFIADNTFVDGWIIVSIAGDITSATPNIPDHIVNMMDIGYICKKFMTTPTSPNWDPNADINNDNIVNMQDIGIACKNFLKPDP